MPLQWLGTAEPSVAPYTAMFGMGAQHATLQQQRAVAALARLQAEREEQWRRQTLAAQQTQFAAQQTQARQATRMAPVLEEQKFAQNTIMERLRQQPEYARIGATAQAEQMKIVQKGMETYLKRLPMLDPAQLEAELKLPRFAAATQAVGLPPDAAQQMVRAAHAKEQLTRQTAEAQLKGMTQPPMTKPPQPKYFISQGKLFTVHPGGAVKSEPLTSPEHAAAIANATRNLSMAEQAKERILRTMKAVQTNIARLQDQIEVARPPDVPGLEAEITNNEKQLAGYDALLQKEETKIADQKAILAIPSKGYEAEVE